MGIFSGKKKTYVGTEITRVIGDSQIPDLRQKNVIDSIFTDTRITHTIVNNAMQSFSLKAERAYRAAARGDYIYGTLEASILDASDGKETLKNILELEVGQAISMDYFYFAPMNNLHVGWQKLTADYGYDEFTNEVKTLSDQKGHKVWVKDMVGYINTTTMSPDATATSETERAPDDGTMEVWGRHPQDRYIPSRSADTKTPVWQMGGAISDGVMVHLVEEDGYESTLFFNLESFDEDVEYFQAKYRYTVSGQTITGYFTYEYGGGVYPILDAIHDNDTETSGTFMPAVLFRHNDTNRTASQYHDTEEYKSTDDLVSKLGMNFQELGDTIHENPDIDKLDQAVMMFAVPASSENSEEIEYLYKFFNWLYLKSPNTSRFQSVGGITHTRPDHAVRFKDADFDCTLSFSNLKRRRQGGSIGEVDTYTHEIIQENRTRTVWRNVCTGSGEDRTCNGEEVVETYVVDLLRYRHQVQTNLYDEIIVDNLQMRYNIFGSKGITANIGSDKLLIPIDYTIAKTLRFDHKEVLFSRSLHFVMNSRITKTVKWYQTGVFQILMIIVAVIIIIATAGAASPIGGAMLAGAYGMVAVYVLVHLAVGYAISTAVTTAIKMVADELGLDVTIVLAVAAFIAAGYGVAVDAEWVNYAIQAANGLVNASTQLMQEQILEYKSEAQEFALLAESKMEELEEIDNLLNSYDLLDPRSFTGMVPTINPGESPDDLYNRTVHSGNIGTLAFDYIESYVDINVQLPTFNNLVGDTFYGI